MAFNPIEAQKCLKDMDYPAQKSDVIEHATSNGAPQERSTNFESHSQDRFENPAEVRRPSRRARWQRREGSPRRTRASSPRLRGARRARR
jgi:hypothetical protein